MVSFVYDGDGNRVARTVNGVTTQYLVDVNNPTGYAQVVDELIGGQVTRSYTFGHNLISQRQLIAGQWQVSFYGYDGQGNVRLLTDFARAITDTYEFDAFGNLIAQTGNTPNEHLYVGESFDANIGFYFLRARYLNPTTNSFLGYFFPEEIFISLFPIEAPFWRTLFLSLILIIGSFFWASVLLLLGARKRERN